MHDVYVSHIVQKYINIKYLRLHTNSTVITYCLYTIDTIKQTQQYTKSTEKSFSVLRFPCLCDFTHWPSEIWIWTGVEELIVRHLI